MEFPKECQPSGFWNGDRLVVVPIVSGGITYNGDYVSTREGSSSSVGYSVYAAVTARSFHTGTINAALMDRVERASDMSTNAFSKFQTAISLEAMVRQRTSQLQDAMGQLAKAMIAEDPLGLSAA